MPNETAEADTSAPDAEVANPFANLAKGLARARLTGAQAAANLQMRMPRARVEPRDPPAAPPAPVERIAAAVAGAQSSEGRLVANAFALLANRSQAGTGSRPTVGRPPAGRSGTVPATHEAPPVSSGRAASPALTTEPDHDIDGDQAEPEAVAVRRGLGVSSAASSTAAVDPEAAGVVTVSRGLGRVAAPPQRPRIEYSAEQLAVIHCPSELILVDAFAGCGKTTTAIGYAEARPREKILYLCLNTANAEESRERFKHLSHVTVLTTHQVAFRAIKPNRDRITRSWRPVLVMDQMGMRNARDARICMAILREFFGSADNEILPRHADKVQVQHDLKEADVANGLAFASLAWKRMRDPSDSLLMPDDAYLKMFAIQAPQLPYTTVIYDEAQDANPVTLQILLNQRNMKMLCIGDRYQAIYGFRGAVNAMDRLAQGATHLHLSQTRRFGPEIARVANTILGELRGETVQIQGIGQDAPWNGERVTMLSRTNAELFRLAAATRGEGVHWVTGVENYRLEQLTDAYHLFARETSLIKDELMRRKFRSWTEFCDYAEDSGDSEARILTGIVEEFEHDVPQLVEDIRRNEVKRSEDAALTLTTAHRSKGLDWDFVQICDDFEVLERAEELFAEGRDAEVSIQDIHLLYVAATRGKKAVRLNEETTKWLGDLDRHRNNREAARSRMRAALSKFSAH